MKNCKGKGLTQVGRWEDTVSYLCYEHKKYEALLITLEAVNCLYSEILLPWRVNWLWLEHTAARKKDKLKVGKGLEILY